MAQDKRNALAALYHADNVPNAPRTLSELLNAYEPHTTGLSSWRRNEAQKRIRSVLASILDYPLVKLDARMIQRAVDAHPTLSTAANAVRYVRPMLKWGRKRGYCALAAEDIEQPRAANKERERVLSEDELRRLLQMLTFEGYDLAARLLLLTAVRLNELCGFHRSELDLQSMLWTIPAARMKARQTHIVPLSSQAATLFELAMQAPGPHPFKSLKNWDRWQKRINARTGTQGWHRHDLRRTAATIMGERLEVEPHVVDAALAHAHLTGNKVARTYNRARYTLKIAIALQALGDYYATLVS